MVSYFFRIGAQSASVTASLPSPSDVDRVELFRLDAVNLRHRGLERGVVALLFTAAVAVAVDRALEQLFRQRHQVLAAVDVLLLGEVDPAFEQFPPQRVDALALLVHDVVVLEQVFADGEVLGFDLLLRPGDGVGHHLVLDRHAFFHAETLHQPGDAVGAEDAHQIVFEREVEPRRAGVALTAGAAAQLVVDAPRLVPLGGDDVQAAGVDDLVVLAIGLALEGVEDALVGLARHAVEAAQVVEVDELVVVDELGLFLRQLVGDLIGERLLPRHELGVAAEQDVGAAAGHVGGDRDGRLAARLGDDLRFLLVVLGVEDDVLDAAQLEQLGQPLRLFDRDRADEDRPPLLLLLDDVGDDRLVFLLLGAVDGVRLFDPLERRGWSG